MRYYEVTTKYLSQIVLADNPDGAKDIVHSQVDSYRFGDWLGIWKLFTKVKVWI